MCNDIYDIENMICKFNSRKHIFYNVKERLALPVLFGKATNSQSKRLNFVLKKQSNL